MSKKQTKSILIKCLSIIAIISFIVMAASIICCCKTKKVEFIKPEFDNNAIIGEIEITEELEKLGYTEFYQDGMTYKFSLCGNITVENKKATVYFTNNKENEVWLKIRILNEVGNILGESGIIKPGEYVKHIDINDTVKSGDKITLKIMGYVPEKYTSAGTVSVNTIIN